MVFISPSLRKNRLDLSNTDLRNSKLTYHQLQDARVEGAKINPETVRASGWSSSQFGILVRNGANAGELKEYDPDFIRRMQQKLTVTFAGGQSPIVGLMLDTLLREVRLASNCRIHDVESENGHTRYSFDGPERDLTILFRRLKTEIEERSALGAHWGNARVLALCESVSLLTSDKDIVYTPTQRNLGRLAHLRPGVFGFLLQTTSREELISITRFIDPDMIPHLALNSASDAETVQSIVEELARRGVTDHDIIEAARNLSPYLPALYVSWPRSARCLETPQTKQIVPQGHITTDHR